MPELAQAPRSHEEIIRAPLNEGLLGVSPAIQHVREVIQRLAESSITVLINGESGTGKDIAARLLHKYSERYGKPFIKVNCPAIPESILESELFGYERGAFTGARTSKPGRFELANHGTIFLDEIAETSYTVQGKLLQVLDGEPFMRIGGVQPIVVDVRVIAATNVDLEKAVREGRMREDVFFRLGEVVVSMPPLRERKEDIPLLAEHFNFNHCERLGKPYKPIPASILEGMVEYEWYGNIRELGACVKKYVTTDDPEALQGEAISPDLAPAGASPRPVEVKPSNGPGESAAKRFIPLKEATQRAVEETERAMIEEALRFTLWNRRKAAKLLKVSYSSLLRRIDAYQIGKAGGIEQDEV
ncbi:MAG: sigma-54-dependent Fis family transcriptional regulator [Candidatus Hydrogenedentes bacterium]|nr:sigma-54-dependent Fis family transcriptional regulator [Candidatus Hydrogenedentota bacterium]